MSTKKITALTELAAAAAATDMIPIVDVSDTTDAASGTTKKITALNVGKGIGVGAGNTTSEPVKIDTSNGRLGVGTASPGYKLVVKATTASNDGIWVTDENDAARAMLYTAGVGFGALQLIDNSNDPQVVLNTNSDSYLNGGKVGIGAASPLTALHVADNGFTCSMERFAGASAAGPGIDFNKSRGNSVGVFTVVADNDTLGSLLFKGADGDSWAAGAMIRASVDGTPGDGDMPGRLEFATTLDGQEAVTERMRLDSTGNLLLGGIVTPTSSVGNLCLFNGTAPAASVTNGVVLYAQDVSTSELKVRDEAGNVSTLSPHNFDMLGDRSEDMAWSYSSKNVFVGKEIAVDMTKVIRALEKLTGEEYIKIRDIADSEKLDWATEEKRKEAEQKKEIDVYKAKKAEFDDHPTNSSTKAEIKTFLDDKGISYEDAPKAELLEKVPEFTEEEPTAYTKKSKPAWIK